MMRMVLVLLLVTAVKSNDSTVAINETTTTTTTTTTTEHACQFDKDCLRGGTCRLADNTVDILYNVCDCPKPYTGTLCDRECPITCENGGICRYDESEDQQHDPFSCSCPKFFTGSLCQIPYTTCLDGTKCLNGGTCVQESQAGSTDYKCNCLKGYEGFTCSVITDEAILQEPQQQPPQDGTTPNDNESEDDTNSARHKYMISMISLAAFVAIFAIMGLRLLTRRRGYRISFRRMTSETAGAFDANTMDDYSRHNREII